MNARPLWLAVAGCGLLAASAVQTAPASRAAADTTAIVSLSSHRPGARRVTLRITIVATLQCGLPVGSVTVGLPVALGLPALIPARTVLLGKAAAAKVTRNGHTIAIAPARPKLTCDSITVGPETLTFGSDADLRNPARPGTYALTVRHGAESFRGTFTIAR